MLGSVGWRSKGVGAVYATSTNVYSLRGQRMVFLQFVSQLQHFVCMDGSSYIPRSLANPAVPVWVERFLSSHQNPHVLFFSL